MRGGYGCASASGSGGSGGPGGRNVGKNRPAMERAAFKPVQSTRLTDWDVRAFNARRVADRTNPEDLDWPVEPMEGFGAVFSAVRETGHEE